MAQLEGAQALHTAAVGEIREAAAGFVLAGQLRDLLTETERRLVAERRRVITLERALGLPLSTPLTTVHPGPTLVFPSAPTPPATALALPPVSSLAPEGGNGPPQSVAPPSGGVVELEERPGSGEGPSKVTLASSLGPGSLGSSEAGGVRRRGSLPSAAAMTPSSPFLFNGPTKQPAASLVAAATAAVGPLGVGISPFRHLSHSTPSLPSAATPTSLRLPPSSVQSSLRSAPLASPTSAYSSAASSAMKDLLSQGGLSKGVHPSSTLPPSRNDALELVNRLEALVLANGQAIAEARLRSR